MQRCDFASIVKLIRDNLLEGNFDNQSEFAETLFASYLEETGACFDIGLLNKWLNGLARLSPSLIQFYLKDRKHREDLAITIEDVIIPCLSDSAMVVQQTVDLLMQDPTVSERKKQELSSYTKEAEILTALLLFGMARPFQAHDVRKSQNDVINQKSPLVNDYILDGDVPHPCTHFCGRDKEMEMLRDGLSQHRIIIVEGVPGIGKSEFAKAYAHRFKKDYTNTLYIPYSGDIQQDIANMCFADDLSSESSMERFYRHDRFLRTLKEDTLLIIDNFDVKSKESSFSYLQKYRCHIIITSRYRWPGHWRFRLGCISDKDALFQMVSRFYPEAEKNRDLMFEIMWETQCHTLTLELIARLLGQGLTNPSYLLSQLKIRGTLFRESDKIRMTKDGKVRKGTVTEHIRTLFDITSLSAEKQNLLRVMTMIPPSGIQGIHLGEWMGLKNLNDVYDLLDLGYLTVTSENRIAMQRIVRKVCVADLRPSISSCKVLLESIRKACLSYGKESDDYILILHIIDGTREIVQDDLAYYFRFLQDTFLYMKKYRYQYGMDMALLDMNRLLVGLGETGHDAATYLYYKAMQQKQIQTKIKKAKEALACLSEETEENGSLLFSVNAYLGYLYNEIGDEASSGEYSSSALRYWMKFGPFHSPNAFAGAIQFALFTNLVHSP